MDKLEALKYICKNYKGYEGGFQMSCLSNIILEDKNFYLKEELDSLIKEMNNY